MPSYSFTFTLLIRKGGNHRADICWSFFFLQVITAFQNVNLSADTRKEMEEWISALKSVGSKSSSVSYANLARM